MSKFGSIFKTAAKSGFSPFGWISAILKNVLGIDVGNAATSYINSKTGAGLTGAQIAQNEWNASEAEKARDWQEQMDNTKYQRQTQDMMNAGLNPAMMYGGSVSASAPTGAAASGSASPDLSGSMVSDVLDVIFAKQRLHNLKEEGIKIQKEGDAAVMQAEAAMKGAGAQERNAGAAERQAAVSEIRANIERDLADAKIPLDREQANYFAEQAAFIREQKDYISKNYEIALKNADANQKSAIAALRSADAAVQNASTNSYLSDYQTDVLYAESLLNSLIIGQNEELLKVLPEKLRYEVENLRKEGLILDEDKRLKHRQGNLATAITVKSYVSTALDVTKAVAEIATPGPAKIGFK